MKHPVFDFLGTSLVPELGTDVSAGPACNGHLTLVPVATVRAFPDQFSAVIFYDFDFTVISTDFTVIALRI